MEGGTNGASSFAESGAAPKGDEVVNAEVGLISAVLSDYDGAHEAMAQVAGTVPAADFADPRRAGIWTAILARHERRALIDPASIAEDLTAAREHHALKHLGDVRKVRVSPSMAVEFATKVRQHGFRRRYAAGLSAALNRALADGSPVDAVSAAQAVVKDLPVDMHGSFDDSMETAARSTVSAVRAYTHACRAGEIVPALWGVRALDGGGDVEGALGGLFPPELILLGGLGGAGKTTLAMQASLTTAAIAKRKVIYFSLEMTREALMQRLIAQAAGIHPRRIKRGKCSDEELRRLDVASAKFHGLPIAIVEDCRTTADIRARVMAERARGPVGLVVVDFLQLVALADETGSSVHDEQRRVYDMKGIANAGRLPVLAITAMTKTGQLAAMEGKANMTSGAGSGSEYAADVYGFLVRVDPDDEGPQPEVRLDLVKVRDGDTSKTLMRFNKKRGRIVDHDDWDASDGG